MDTKRLSFAAADVLKEARLIIRSVDKRQWIEGTLWLVAEAALCLGAFFAVGNIID